MLWGWFHFVCFGYNLNGHNIIQVFLCNSMDRRISTRGTLFIPRVDLHGVPNPQSQVPSPDMKAKSQLLNLENPSKNGLICMRFGQTLITLCKTKLSELVLQVGSSFFALTQFSTQITSLTFKKHCHVDIHVKLEDLEIATM